MLNKRKGLLIMDKRQWTAGQKTIDCWTKDNGQKTMDKRLQDFKTQIHLSFLILGFETARAPQPTKFKVLNFNSHCRRHQIPERNKFTK